ncbi:MAG TPA: hypothetical protein VFT64_04175 [Rickettsiales bacterium]|nr:hypothetical protein [Rickettsiales bacterium]
MDHMQRMMMEGQAQRNAAGDQGTKKNGFLLNLLPRVPDSAGDAIWGIGSRVWCLIKRIPGGILGLFGSEQMPNKIEMVMARMHEDMQRANQEAWNIRAQHMSVSGDVFTGHGLPSEGVGAPKSGAGVSH